MQDPHTVNYNTLLKGIKEDFNKWRDILCHESEDSKCLRHQFSPDWSVDSLQSQLRSQKGFVKFFWFFVLVFLVDIDKLTQCKETRKARKTEKKIGGLTLPKFYAHYKIAVTKTMWFWHEDRKIDEWNRMESRNKPTHVCSIDFQQRSKGIWCKKDALYDGAWTTENLCQFLWLL